MTHDENLARLGDELGEGTGHHAGLDPCAPLGLLGPAAVEGKIVPVLDDGLIAAARERHLDREIRERIVFLKRASVLADAKGNRRVYARGVHDGANCVQDRELALLKPGEVLAFKEQKIPVALHFAAQRVKPCDPAGDSLIDLCIELRNRRVRQIAHELVVVINKNDRRDGARAQKLVAHIKHLRHVDKEDGRKAHGRLVVLRANVVSVDAVPARANQLVSGKLAAPFAQPPGRKAGDNSVQRLVLRAVGKTCDGVKAVVAPDDLALRQADDGHRKRRARVDGDPFCVSCALHVAHERVSAPDGEKTADHHHDDGHNQLAHREIILVKKRRGRRKGQHDQAVPEYAGLQQLCNMLVHTGARLL